MSDKLKKFLVESEYNNPKRPLRVPNDVYYNIQRFFLDNPRPTDEQVHEFSESLGIDGHQFEQYIYEILGAFIGEGRAKRYDGSYDESELEMGIQVEYEHTTSRRLSERIAKDHIAEIPDYYTRLAKMEEDARKYWENRNK